MKAFLKHFAVEVCALRSMLVGFAAFATLPTTTIFDFTELSFGQDSFDTIFIVLDKVIRFSSLFLSHLTRLSLPFQVLFRQDHESFELTVCLKQSNAFNNVRPFVKFSFHRSATLAVSSPWLFEYCVCLFEHWVSF